MYAVVGIPKPSSNANITERQATTKSTATQTEIKSALEPEAVHLVSAKHAPTKNLKQVNAVPIWETSLGDYGKVPVYAFGYMPPSGPFLALQFGVLLPTQNSETLKILMLDEKQITQGQCNFRVNDKQRILTLSTKNAVLNNLADAWFPVMNTAGQSDNKGVFEFGLNIWKLAALPLDLVKSPAGIHGLVADKSSEFHPSRWYVDWTDSHSVQSAQQERSSYQLQLLKKRKEVEKQIMTGKPIEEIAEKLVNERNADRMRSYSSLLEKANLVKRNLIKYRRPMGPSYHDQLRKYHTPEGVIEAALRSNASMDLLTGVAKVKWIRG